jgi:hypothetical protein
LRRIRTGSMRTAVGDVMGFAKPLPLAKIKKYKAIEDSLREG